MKSGKKNLKKNYQPPRLVIYGDFKKLTRSKGSTRSDGSGKPATKNCNPNS